MLLVRCLRRNLTTTSTTITTTTTTTFTGTTTTVVAALRRRCFATTKTTPPAQSLPAKRQRNYVGAAVFGTLVVGTFGLGVWQTNRYYWKDELIQQREASLAADPVDLLTKLKQLLEEKGVVPFVHSTNPVDTEALHYTRISARGVFDHSNEIFIGPRVPPKQEHGGGMNIAEVGGESSGYFVVTPLILEDNGGTILVQRGWIPNPLKTKFKSEPALRFTRGTVTVRGVVVPPEVEKLFSPPNDVVRRRFLWFDPIAACQATGILLDGGAGAKPLILNATERCHEGQFPVVSDVSTYSTFHVGLETHATYAGTWYALSFFGAIMNYIRFLR
jgi:surfeit locus 1 family protein